MKIELELPSSTYKIFDFLSEGKFLCKNHPEPEHDRLYRNCLKYYTDLKKYFSYLKIDLINEEDDYFYFGDLKVVEEDSNEITIKLKEFIKFIRFYSILVESYKYFGAGTAFTLARLEQNIIESIPLRSKYKKDNKGIRKELESEVKMFLKSGYIYRIDSKDDKYIALASMQRLKEFIGNISIDDEIFEEVEEVIKNGEDDE